jgi:transcriptional regulator with XRE-family HTH domain
VDSRNEIRDFLTSRRAKITPERAGLPACGGNRRGAGLRREEVALLAGVSVDYYTRLERGNARGVSDNVLEALARALQTGRGRTRTPIRPRPGREHDEADAAPARQAPGAPSVQRILDAMATAPAYVRNERLDILAANQLGQALMAPAFADPVRPVNLARFIFLDRSAREFYVEWDRLAADTVAMLRAEAGRNPLDRGLSDLIGELSTRSETFRIRWAAHNVRFHRTGVKHFRHPIVGDLSLTYEALELTADPGLTITAYSAEPGSPSHDALNLLASWTATPHEQPAAHATEQT